jgi:hypothetical protein
MPPHSRVSSALPTPASSALARRTLLKGAGAMAMALGTLRLVGEKASLPQRMRLVSDSLPDIQFDIGAYVNPPQTLNDGGGNVLVNQPPVNTVFTTARLNRTPTTADQQMLSAALAAIEANYPFAAGGIITFISYGIPYFSRLPGGLNGSLVAAHMPRLATDGSTYALQEAVPGPTDVFAPGAPGGPLPSRIVEDSPAHVRVDQRRPEARRAECG